MDKANRAPVRPSLAVILSAGCLVLGVAGIVWASVNIGIQWPRADTGASGVSSQPAMPLSAKGGSAVAEAEQVATSDVPAVQALYPVRPATGEPVGTLFIPSLGQTLPIIEGTGSDELKEGVGHFEQSVLPGEPDNCVLSGHRDTHFSELGGLQVGDLLVVQTSAGTFTYSISNIRIVDKDDRTVIVPTDHAVLTLSTCYPFIYVGSAPDRYVISADGATE